MYVSDVSEAMEGFNPMEEDYFSERNSYNIDVDDAGVATTGYSKWTFSCYWEYLMLNIGIMCTQCWITV